jgi:hypothetical protein
MLLMVTRNIEKCYGYKDYVVLQVLCYALTLIKNIIYVFVIKDEMGDKKKIRKKLWISPKAIAKEIIYTP